MVHDRLKIDNVCVSNTRAQVAFNTPTHPHIDSHHVVGLSLRAAVKRGEMGKER